MKDSSSNILEKGFTAQEAVAEAFRCLKCEDAPCNKGCPSKIDVLKFIKQISSKNFLSAIRTIRETNVLPETCALICPHDEFCQAACSSTNMSKPIQIGRLQRFIAEWERRKVRVLPRTMEPRGIPICVVGAGPAGLSAAAALKILGYEVGIYESNSQPGGLLTHVIPSYRLPVEVIEAEIKYVRNMGIHFYFEKKVENIWGLKERYAAVFLGVGASVAKRLAIEGADLQGVRQGLDLLREIKKNEVEGCKLAFPIGRKIEVIGGGNTAIDAAISMKRLGAETVTIRYRRSESEMPAWRKEVDLAKREGVALESLCMPLRFLGRNGKLKEIEYAKVKSSEGVDESGRPALFPVKGSEFRIEADMVILAIGQSPELKTFEGLERETDGKIRIDRETMATSVEGVYAGGDAVGGRNTAVEAIADGKHAATRMDSYVTGKSERSFPSPC